MTASASTKSRSSTGFVAPVMGVLGLIDRTQLGWFMAMLVALLASAGITLGFGYVLKGLVDEGFSARNTARLDNSLVLMLAMVAALAVASFARLSISGYLSEQLVARLRIGAFSHLLSLDPGFFQRRASAEVSNAVSSDTTMIGTVLATSLPLVVRNILLVTGGIVMLVATSPHLTMLVMLVLPLVALPVVLIGRMVRRNAKGAQERTGQLGGLMGETLAAVQTVQSFTAEGSFSARFAAAAQDTLRAAMRQVFSRSMMASSIIFILFSSLCAVMWVGAHDVMRGTMSAGALTSFVFYAAIVASAFGVLGDVGAALFRAAAALERIREIMALEPRITSPLGAEPMPAPIQGAVQIENVHFKYDDAPVLDGFTITVGAGETVAILGPSGAGKTTLFQLLMRFYDPQVGRILLDGRDIRALPLAQLRGAIAYVPQDGALFSGSVRDNLLIGKPDATQEEVEQAARDAMAHDFICDLPQGYDTLLGERGMRLSGGQKQRIALARALLKSAPVLLLDEATASLDTENEKAIQKALGALRGKRTVMIIAHRLSTVLEADRIFVMHQGRVVEQGSHSELLAKNGVYARMIEQQFGQVETELRRTRPGLSDSLH